jgi:hypothetical protein
MSSATFWTSAWFACVAPSSSSSEAEGAASCALEALAFLVLRVDGALGRRRQWCLRHICGWLYSPLRVALLGAISEPSTIKRSVQS